MKTSHDNSIADSQEIEKFHESVLSWYKNNQRSLPWRSRDPSNSNPYHVWLSEIMLQQTTVQAVIPYFLKFTETWKNIEALAQANEQDIMDAWAGLGYYSRARNLHKCAKILVEKYDSKLPTDYKSLLDLPGVGPYTAGAISSIGFNQPAEVIDGNVERIITRYLDIHIPLPQSKPTIKKYTHHLMTQHNPIPHSFVQGLMDIGATICQPKKTQCDICPLSEGCMAYKNRTALEIPKKIKQEKQQRYGVCFIVKPSDNTVIIQRRPEQGLLANMQGFPSTDFIHTKNLLTEYEQEIDENLYIEHVFTHFKLKLYIIKCDQSYFKKLNFADKMKLECIQWKKIDNISFPTLFKKVLKKVKTKYD